MSDVVYALSSVVPPDELEETMAKISASRFPQFELLSTLNGGRNRFIDPNATFKLNISKNFRVPMRFSCCRAKTPMKIMDAKVFALKQFMDTRGNAISPFDILRVARNGFLTSPQVREFITVNSWGSGLRPSQVFPELSNPISKGTFMSTKDHSYTKLRYSMGRPAYDGARPSEACLLNRDWNVVDQESKDNRRYVMTDDEEVWVDEMFENEDENSQMDQRICRNLNVIRMLMSSVNAGFMSPMVLSELRAIYGPAGALMVSLLEKAPKIAYPIVRRRLEQRFHELFAMKVERSAHWGQVWSKGRMKRRVMYQTPLREQPDMAFFANFPDGPITYKVENTHLLSYFIDKICENKEFENASDFKDAVRKVLTRLREPATKNEDVSLEFLTIVCLGAQLVKLVGELDVIDAESLSGVRIASDLGLTTPGEHGYTRVMLALTKSVFRKGKRKNMEMPSMLFDMNSGQTSLIELTASLFWKAVKLYVENKDEIRVAILEYGGGSVAPFMRGPTSEAPWKRARLNLEYLVQNGKSDRRGPRA